MLVYFVIGDSPQLEAKIQSEYPQHHQSFHGGWIVAADNKTTSDIAESLGMNGTEEVTGIVVKADSYYGYYNASLWERINLWKNESA